MLQQLQLDIESISLCGRVKVPTDGIVHDPLLAAELVTP